MTFRETQTEHESVARYNEGRAGMPQGPCQCEVCQTLTHVQKLTQANTALEAQLAEAREIESALRECWEQDVTRGVQAESALTESRERCAKLEEALRYAGWGQPRHLNRLRLLLEAHRSTMRGDNWDFWNYVIEKFDAALSASPVKKEGE